MKSKSLSRMNPFLSGAGAFERHVRNVASSTAIETGRPIAHYMNMGMEHAAVFDSDASYLDQVRFSRSSKPKRSREK